MMKYKTISKLISIALVSTPVLSIADGYDLTSSNSTSYDTVCDTTYGCYQKIQSSDDVTKSSTLSYIISQDQDGKAISAYNENRIDGKLISSEVTNYTPSNRLLGNESYFGVSNHLVADKSYDYDVYDRIEKETLKSYDDNEALFQTNYLTHEYDNWNIDKEIQKTLSSTVANSGAYKNYRIAYDVFGRAISMSYSLNGKTYSTSSQYDGADRMVKSTDFNTNATTKLYDDNGHLVQSVTNGVISSASGTTPDNKTINYSYDNYARLKTSALDDSVLGYSYNAVGLQSAQSVDNNIDGSNDSAAQNFTYDDYNRLKSYTDYNGMLYSIFYKPDSEIDHVTVSSDVLNGTMTPLKYGYDDSVGYWLKGKRYQVTIEMSTGGHTQTKIANVEYYSPSDAVYPIEIGMKKSISYVVKQDGVNVADLKVQTAYDDQGRITEEAYSSTSGDNNLNKTTDYVYDPLNRLVQSVTIFTGTMGLKKQIIDYVYNINGDILKRTEADTNEDGSVTTTVSDYTYNEIDQLLTKTDTVTTS
ncbi:RHS repeat domain-containing protein [Fangia hongkongensis]|uniref:hypothetical protein n=2 Tax=Fangia hongkongensis TaxID=270495 RepID=UPI00039CDDBF|nr:hypothetical protein [Fangia hongkongensis]